MADDEFETGDNTGYKPPKQATLEEMKNKDADDEALNRWKASLLKNGAAPRPHGARPAKTLAGVGALTLQALCFSALRPVGGACRGAAADAQPRQQRAQIRAAWSCSRSSWR